MNQTIGNASENTFTNSKPAKKNKEKDQEKKRKKTKTDRNQPTQKQSG